MHSNLAISAKVGSQARHVRIAWAGDGRQEQAAASQSVSHGPVAGPLGHGDGPGDEHPMQSVPGNIAEGDSQACVQVGPLVDS